MIFCNLGSGSKGNCTYIQNSGKALLIDQGFSLKNLILRMEKVNLSPTDVSAIILTHEHSDHIKGAGIFARRYKTPIFMTKKTFQAIDPKKLTKVKVEFFTSGDTLSLEYIKIKTFHLPHDAADPIGIVASSGDKKLGIITDLGTVTQSVLHYISELDLLFLESNHDKFMLLNGPYPLQVIQRIKSRVGHLSNKQSLNLFNRISHNGRLKYLILGHLSETNNDAQIVRELFEKTKAENSISYKIEIASQNSPGTVINM